MNTTLNNVLIAEFMELEYFPNSKQMQEDAYGCNHGFIEYPVWVSEPTELYRQCPVHYGYEYNVETEEYEGEIKKEDLFKEYHYSLQYHTSWDWLMPVVEKIRHILDFNFDLYIELWEKIKYELSHVNLIYTYNAVIEFINWYNKQK